MQSFLNVLSAADVQWVWALAWQSSLVILLILAIERLLVKAPASVRYALLLLALFKLVLPPSLAAPSSPAWWLRERPVLTLPDAEVPVTFSVKHGAAQQPPSPAAGAASETTSAQEPFRWLSLVGLMPALALLGLMFWRFAGLARQIRRCPPAPLEIDALARGLAESLRLRPLPIRVGPRHSAPSVAGLLNPTILLPAELSSQLPLAQLRIVLLHEFVHHRRKDLWVNFLQTFLQALYWWHPLVWVLNARIRRVREEAVDDQVMTILGAQAHEYPPTLIAVARHYLERRSDAIVALRIVESASTLKHRVARSLDFVPGGCRRAGLAWAGTVAVLGAIVLPLGAGPADSPPRHEAGQTLPIATNSALAYTNLTLEPVFLSIETSALSRAVPALFESDRPVTFKQASGFCRGSWKPAQNGRPRRTM